MVARRTAQPPPRTAVPCTIDPRSSAWPHPLTTIWPVSRGLKVLLLALLTIFVAREIMFRRNLADFNPDTAPFGD